MQRHKNRDNGMICNFLKSCDYENGYKQALLDVCSYIERHSQSIKYSKMSNVKGIVALVNAMAEHYDVFMRLGDETAFRVGKDRKVLLDGCNYGENSVIF